MSSILTVDAAVRCFDSVLVDLGPAVDLPYDRTDLRFRDVAAWIAGLPANAPQLDVARAASELQRQARQQQRDTGRGTPTDALREIALRRARDQFRACLRPLPQDRPRRRPCNPGLPLLER